MDVNDDDNCFGPPPPIAKKAPQGRWHVYQAPYATEYMMHDAYLAWDAVSTEQNYLFPEKPRRTTRVHLFSVHLRANEAQSLSEGQRGNLNQILEEYEDVFREQRPPTPYMEHGIPTGEHTAISQPSYRLTPAKTAQLKTEIDGMLEADIIEECDTPWASPVVMVPKRDGTIRLCIDYRKLNSITTPDVYPLLRMDDLLHSAGKSRHITTLDLQAGYWQIRVRTEDRDKTAFICPFGLYRFTRMPFGLRNAPAMFQRLIDRFKAGLPDVTLLGYLDDLIVISKDFEKHLKDLRQVLERLRLYQLCFRRPKCTFCCQRTQYLGHYMSPEGISVAEDKVTALLERAAPRNLKQLQTFLQTCSWFRKFIPHFAEVARPLTQLTKKDAIWEWGSSQEAAYNSLKEKLTSAPILRQADLSQPFVLRTNASAYALVA